MLFKKCSERSRFLEFRCSEHTKLKKKPKKVLNPKKNLENSVLNLKFVNILKEPEPF